MPTGSYKFGVIMCFHGHVMAVIYEKLYDCFNVVIKVFIVVATVHVVN